ncbi:thioesterase family protein [Nocardioides marmoriginsengisoli]|uniref:Thioesterase family protein n=1 Tax=Nocardioides marmoriginsengisoli TaxID=661483 RepID=A0A3N0CGN8_9ACTN|nr:thioesterase family protein [Nocardioides marmoriginsengisoli]RNL62624.1 thioesterase family protein [Nocardioides marmoriginsengisoli]
MTFEYDRDTALRPRGDGAYDADLAPGWLVGGGVNGGYLLAIIGNAVAAELGTAQPAKQHVDPFSVSAHYLSASTAGPAYVRTEVVRSGGRFSTVAATLLQDVDGTPVPRIAAHATFGNLDSAHDAKSDLEASALGLALEAPVLPPPEECLESRDAPPEVKKIAPLLDRFGTRFDPETAGWAVGEPSRRGVIQGWFKLADDRPLDPISLLMVVDALPPTTFDLGMPGWAPTLELTAHVRAKPAPGWAIVRHRTRTVAGGLFEEDCEVWDSTGTLVAQSRQLALQPRS